MTNYTNTCSGFQNLAYNLETKKFKKIYKDHMKISESTVLHDFMIAKSVYPHAMPFVTLMGTMECSGSVVECLT